MSLLVASCLDFVIYQERSWLETLAYLSSTGVRLVPRVLTHVLTFPVYSREKLARAERGQSIIADLLYDLQ